MNLKSVLRAMIAIEIAAIVAAVASEMLLESTLPVPLRNYVQNEQVPPFFMVVATILIVLTIVSWVALWRFARWAPSLFAAVWIAGLFVSPLGGPYVTTGLGDGFESLGTTIDGVILALVFWSPLRRDFRRAT